MKATAQTTLDLNIKKLRDAYFEQEITPAQVIERIIERSAVLKKYNIWICPPSLSWIQPFLDNLRYEDLANFPLWGIPFALKDNIDLQGLDTTAGCREFSYKPKDSAFVVQRLIDAGAIPIGKANLDQFATGLNGTRSPYGCCHNSFEFNLISGGSSSGSAVAVAMGLSSFSLGTDTAGSGRVPAGFNNIVGLKPTRGLLSCMGVVPACRSIDCLSIFALTTDDANAVFSVALGPDPEYEFCRSICQTHKKSDYGLANNDLTIGVIARHQLKFFGDDYYRRAYLDTLNSMISSGFKFTEIDYSPFQEAGELLYEGPWISERHLAVESLIKNQPQVLHPVVREIIEPGQGASAKDLFRAQYRLSKLKLVCEKVFSEVDCILTPSAGRHFSISEILKQPIATNTQLGFYTNFVNMLDLASVVVPTSLQRKENGGYRPFGVALVGPAMSDRWLLSIANTLQQVFKLPAGNTCYAVPKGELRLAEDPRFIDIAVCGAHLSGLPLNWQLTDRGAKLKQSTTTADLYRLFALDGRAPRRPGLVRDNFRGKAISIEVWSVPVENLGSFLQDIPSPLGIGKIILSDGSAVSGFICESWAIGDALDITSYKSWRSWLKDKK